MDGVLLRRLGRTKATLTDKNHFVDWQNYIEVCGKNLPLFFLYSQEVWCVERTTINSFLN